MVFKKHLMFTRIGLNNMYVCRLLISYKILLNSILLTINLNK